jgi:hypothetical protein
MKKILSTAAKLVSLGLIASALTTASTLPSSASTCDASSSLSGVGTFGEPFLISTPGDLVFLANSHDDAINVSLGKYYELTENLDMTGCTMLPIGSNVVGKEFQGVFLGESKTISNLILDRSSLNEAAGLFAYAEGAEIKDLIMKNANIIGYSSVGAVVGRGIDTSLTNIRVEASRLTSTFQMVGGVAGELKDSGQSQAPTFTAENLVVTNTFIFGDQQAGGVIGNLTGYSASTRFAFTNGTIYLTDSVEGAVAGGLIGQVDLTGAGSLSDSVFSGTINVAATTNQPVAAGLIGKVASGSAFTISNSAALGLIDSRATATLGGLVGSATNLGTITNSYLELQFQDGRPEILEQRVASPFGPGNPTLSASFANATVHTNWVTNSFPLAAQKDTSQIRTASTFVDAGWSVQTSGDIIRNPGAETIWLSNQEIQSGVPVLNWAYQAGLHNTDCSPGRYSVDGFGPCVAAAPGYFVSDFRSTAAIECPVGTFQPNAGASGCIDAEPGHFSSFTGLDDDIPCPTGFYQDETGQTECKTPDAGFYAQGEAQTSQVACPAGTYKPVASSADCSPADPGRHVPGTQATAQIDCEPGTYQELAGQSACVNTGPGYFSNAGSASRQACDAGTYQPNARGADCLPAEIGHFVSESAQAAQIPCTYGEFQSLTGQTSCELAPAGRYVPTQGATQAILCPPGSYQPQTGERDCILAPVGSFVSEAGAIAATACPTGTTSERGATSCSGGNGGGAAGGGALPIATAPTPLTSNPLSGGQQLLIQGPLGPIAASPSLGASGRTMLLELGSSNISLGGNSGLVFSNDGSASLTGNSPLEIAATGFSPGSQVVLYLIPVGQFTTVGFVRLSTPELADAVVAADGSFSLNPQINAAPGDYILQLSGTTDSLQPITLAFALEIKADKAPGFWTKKFGLDQGKMYAKNPIGQGKVQFFVNGKEIAWVRAADDTDRKLRKVTEGPMAGVSYLVRTVDFVKGKNALEIYLDGERVWRAAYTLR